MDPTIKGIMARYNDSSADAVALRAVCLGGLWLSMAPDTVGPELVCITITPIAGPIEHTMGSSESRTFVSPQDIQFMTSSIKASLTDVVDAHKKLRTLFDFATLSTSDMGSGRVCLMMAPTDSWGPLRDDVTGGHMMYVTYRVLVGG